MSRRGSNKELAQTPISAADIEKYAVEQSDLAFEMEILRLVKQNCSGETRWGGLYYDPHTGKQRQYDIQTELPSQPFSPQNWIKLAIECKHLKPNYPLVVCCTPRNGHEQFIDVWQWPPMAEEHFALDENGNAVHCAAISDPHYRRHICSPTLFYSLNRPVGRSLDQVGKNGEGDWITEDSSIFDKWSQALASLHSLLDDTLTCNRPGNHWNLVFLPVVVVPDGTLWQINYSSNGQQTEPPKQVNSIRYWVDITYNFDKGLRKESYRISHLHFFTKTGLANFLNDRDALLDAFQGY